MDKIFISLTLWLVKIIGVPSAVIIMLLAKQGVSIPVLWLALPVSSFLLCMAEIADGEKTN